MHVQESRFTADCNVFYITSWGHCGDHWYSKALNAHPEIFVLNAYEGSRPKYIRDGLGRHQRPDLLAYTAFLEDLGTDYAAIGECHAYRASHMSVVLEKYGPGFPVINLLRHPYVWLDFYIRHRAGNLRMPDGSQHVLDHEWDHANHAHFRSIGLPPYEKGNVEIWCAYQGALLLNQVVADIASGVRPVRIEALLDDGNTFAESVHFLTRERCWFDDRLLDSAYQMALRSYRGEETRADPEAFYSRWETWKRGAFDALLSRAARDAFQGVGYEFF